MEERLSRLGFLGLGKLDLATEASISFRRSRMFRLCSYAGRPRLYVNYRKGIRGSMRHDAIGYFDTASDRFAARSQGLPMWAKPSSPRRTVRKLGRTVRRLRFAAVRSRWLPGVPAACLTCIDTGNNKLTRRWESSEERVWRHYVLTDGDW